MDGSQGLISPQYARLGCGFPSLSVSASSESTATRLISDFKRLTSLIGMHMRDVSLYNYRVLDQKRPSETLVWGESDMEKLSCVISDIAGEAVQVINSIPSYTDPTLSEHNF